MSNEISVTQLAGSIPDVVRKEALEARYDDAVISKNVSNYDTDVAVKSDRVSLSIMPAVAINSVGSGGSVTNQQLSTTAVEVTVDTWVECTVEVDDRALRQSALSIIKAFGKAFGRALAQKQDLDLAADWGNLDADYAVGGTTVGDATPLDDAMVRLSRLKLNKNSSGNNGTGMVPRAGRKWFLSPDAEADLLALARFSEAQTTGFARGLQIEGGEIKKLYGDPVFVTDQIATSAPVRKNLYLHEEALAIATQKNFSITPLAKTKLSEQITAHILYGIKTVRADHAVVVSSAENTDA